MIKNLSLIIVVAIILLVTGCSSSAPAPIVEGWHQPEAKNSAYTVQKGDTLYSIAWAFDMDFRQLAAINHLAPPYNLNAGQRLAMSMQPDYGKKLLKTVYFEKKTLVKLELPSVPAKIAKVSYAQIPSPDKIAQPEFVKAPVQPVKGWWLPAKGKIVRGFSLAPGGNRGIEIAGKLGEPVVASAAGKVVYSGAGLRGYGNLIIIKHNDTYLSAYAFNKKLLVKEGSNVKAGQVIALMGMNNAGQAILHFEIRRNGKPIDPKKLLIT